MRLWRCQPGSKKFENYGGWLGSDRAMWAATPLTKSTAPLIAELPGMPVKLVATPTPGVKWNQEISLPPFTQVAPETGLGGLSRTGDNPSAAAGGSNSHLSGPRGAPSASPREGARSESRDTSQPKSGSPSVDPSRLDHDSARVTALTSPDVIRTSHPANAAYDVVIQSSPADVLPEGVEFLSGQSGVYGLSSSGTEEKLDSSVLLAERISGESGESGE
ncbi:MAG: hypothetical protein IT167_17825 [Bryobacterales bacterium]|nr:hypothetical protein [Bryobacterales bacterium]